MLGVYGADMSVLVVRAWREGIEDAVEEVGEGVGTQARACG